MAMVGPTEAMSAAVITRDRFPVSAALPMAAPTVPPAVTAIPATFSLCADVDAFFIFTILTPERKSTHNHTREARVEANTLRRSWRQRGRRSWTPRDAGARGFTGAS